MTTFLVYFFSAMVGGFCGAWLVDKWNERQEKKKREQKTRKVIRTMNTNKK